MAYPELQPWWSKLLRGIAIQPADADPLRPNVGREIGCPRETRA